MITNYERRAAISAVMAAYAETDRKRRLFVEQRNACDRMVLILKRIEEKKS